MDQSNITGIIEQKALELGFAAVGFASVSPLEQHRKDLEAWLAAGLQASMDYMANNLEKRLDPAKLMPGTKSIVVLLHNYYPTEELPSDKYKIARYAYGRDYHKVLKKKMKTLWEHLKAAVPELEGRYFVDSAPIMERQWAEIAGLGWRGKNSLLLNKKAGSYFFISELLINIELEVSTHELTDYCGTCTKCMEACPTDAIVAEGVIDANKCISYLTIEHKGEIEPTLAPQMQNWIFGCDICQEVCPWNRFSIAHNEVEFAPKPALKELKAEDWLNLTQEKFDEIFMGSAVKRTGFEGLKRNIKSQDASGN